MVENLLCTTAEEFTRSVNAVTEEDVSSLVRF